MYGIFLDDLVILYQCLVFIQYQKGGKKIKRKIVCVCALSLFHSHGIFKAAVSP